MLARRKETPESKRDSRGWSISRGTIKRGNTRSFFFLPVKTFKAYTSPPRSLWFIYFGRRGSHVSHHRAANGLCNIASITFRAEINRSHSCVLPLSTSCQTLAKNINGSGLKLRVCLSKSFTTSDYKGFISLTFLQ